MATGATNISGERIPFFERGMVPKSSSVKEGYALAHTSDAGDNLTVDVPNAPTALLGGRAFAGISASAGTVDPASDNQVTVQKLGVAKCALKASTACTRGDEAGYVPADGGLIVPVTPGFGGVVIGRFTQSKAASVGVQMVGVELHADGSGSGEQLLGAIVASSTTITNTATETAFDLSIPLPANRILKPGTVLKIRAKARITSGNANDTLQLKARLDTATGVIFGQTPAVNVTDAGGDLAVLDLVATVRTVGASGTLVCDGIGGITPGQATATGGNVQMTGTAGTVAIDTTVAHAIVITALWGAMSSGNVVVLEDLVVTIFA